MLKSTFAAIVALGFMGGVALADDASTAIAACRTAVAPELGVEARDLNVDSIKTRARTVELRLEARRNGARVAAECTYDRRASATTVAVLAGPTQQAASEPAPTGSR